MTLPVFWRSMKQGAVQRKYNFRSHQLLGYVTQVVYGPVPCWNMDWRIWIDQSGFTVLAGGGRR